MIGHDDVKTDRDLLPGSSASEDAVDDLVEITRRSQQKESMNDLARDLDQGVCRNPSRIVSHPGS